MKKEILILILNHYADWEGAYVSSVLNQPEGDYTVKTLTESKGPVQSMGGFTVLPDYTADELPEHFELLIMIGGTEWMKGSHQPAKDVVERCLERKIPIAAICDACTFLAENGYLDHVPHTGNSAAYLREFAPHYRGTEHFVEKQVVSAGDLITANGTAVVEFAREIFLRLNLMPEEQLDEWYRMFKIGYYPE